MHLVYFLTHPAKEDLGDVQTELSISASGSFVIQVWTIKSNQSVMAVKT